MPDDTPRIVLVVDDDSAIGDNLKEILEMEGYVCWLARSADAGLRLLELELRSPDVILLDFLMPGMSVRRFISRLKDRATWARAPIILISAALQEDIPPDLQIDALLPKPFSLDLMLEIVSGRAHHAATPAMPNSGT
jgi:two-component system, OmpR family, phosphate regulon response regulator PhoB